MSASRLAVLASHPVQYYAPLFRELARRFDLRVFYAHRATPTEQGRAGFGAAFDWDVDLISGYAHTFLENVARNPDASRFNGCDTPGISGAIADGGFGAVLSLGWHLKSLLQGIRAAKRRGIPVLVRGDSHLETPRAGWKRAVKQLAYPVLLRAFDAVAYVGERSRDYYCYYRYPADRMFFSPHCVDGDWFTARATPAVRKETRARLGIGDSSRAILFAGKLQALKRPLDVVDAAATRRAGRFQVEVIVAGSGELEQAIRRRAAERGVKLHMLGFMNQTQMPAAYAACDVLVMPSERETWGLVANEALACGKPVIVSDRVGCAPDLARNDRAGRTFPMGDIPALASALDSVLAEPPPLSVCAELTRRYSLSAAADGIVGAVAHVQMRRPEKGISSTPEMGGRLAVAAQDPKDG